MLIPSQVTVQGDLACVKYCNGLVFFEGEGNNRLEKVPIKCLQPPKTLHGSLCHNMEDYFHRVGGSRNSPLYYARCPSARVVKCTMAFAAICGGK